VDGRGKVQVCGQPGPGRWPPEFPVDGRLTCGVPDLFRTEKAPSSGLLLFACNSYRPERSCDEV
ncbi:hypothetical protein ACIP44_30675, partial [Streptomyces diastaticus]|uniref:hypothetical protein n=1 Tax=Streptomyces diastaticus TaxID=1956 RepID=UPI00382E9B9A